MSEREAKTEAEVEDPTDELSDEAVLFATDIMSTGFGAIEAASLRYGDSVAVFAQGPVGLCVTAAARARGAGMIIAVETIPARVAMARRLGADVVLAPDDAIEKIMALTGGKGVDVAIEALGKQTTLESAARVRPALPRSASLASSRPGRGIRMDGLSARQHRDQGRDLLGTTFRRPHCVGAKHNGEQVLFVERAEGLPRTRACINGGAQVSGDGRRVRGALRGVGRVPTAVGLGRVDLALAVRGQPAGRP